MRGALLSFLLCATARSRDDSSCLQDGFDVAPQPPAWHSSVCAFSAAISSLTDCYGAGVYSYVV